MITQKKITELFEVKRNTLGLWKTTKPNLYNYLINYDGKNDKYRKLTLLLQEYIKETNTNIFTTEQILYILELNLLFDINFNSKNIALLFIDTTQKQKLPTTNKILDIAYKLSSLNLIEKYIFCEVLEDITVKLKTRKDEKDDLIRYYFKEFLER